MLHQLTSYLLIFIYDKNAVFAYVFIIITIIISHTEWLNLAYWATR